jgi:hypothetical protein
MRSVKSLSGELLKPDTNQVDPLVDYLNYYNSLTEPGFAVLVIGPWGSGKTFQVKAAFDKSSCNYVSLFGLKNEVDVYGAIFSKMDPFTSKFKKATKHLKNIAASTDHFSFGVGSIVTSAINATIKEQVDTSKTLILDDLERCTLDEKTLLGIVNSFVEHQGCRVVVIAHDEKLSDYFAESKEKIFGQTIKTKSQRCV